jgi:ParB family chromosome partitioning protein
MKIVEIPVEQLKEDPNNANVMDQQMTDRLRESIRRYGLVQNLVVRPKGKDAYEVLSGNQRLKVIKEMGFTVVSCVVIEVSDAQARLLSQALNRIRFVAYWQVYR